MDAQGLIDHLVDAYGLGAASWTLTPVTRGAMGRIFRLSGGDCPWAVKELIFGFDGADPQREAALRNAASLRGVVSPRLMPNRDGQYASRLPAELGGSYVKLYDWVEGAAADVSDQRVIDWVGRTLAQIHLAGEATTDMPDAWYVRCPQDHDWTSLAEAATRSGAPWAQELTRFTAFASELASLTTATGLDDVVISHLDFQPKNVLVGASGPVLLDWDDVGPASAGYELADVVYTWSVTKGGLNVDSARRLVSAYRQTGGPGAITDTRSFSMLIATRLNYIYVQARAAIDPSRTDEERDFAGSQVVAGLRRPPDLEAISRIIAAVH